MSSYLLIKIWIMNIFKCVCLSIGTLIFISCHKEEPISVVIEHGLDVATEQSLLMAQKLKDEEGALPRTFDKGKFVSTTYSNWVSGFFPGVLWYLYANTPTDELKTYAELYTERVELAKNITSNHDVGFMLNCSFGNGYRLTHNAHYLEVLKTGAESLATRYNDTVRSIKSWNKRGKWKFPVIIDNMMNLELFTFIYKELGEEKFNYMANAHAMTTLKNHFRPDYSCYHVVSYNPETGAVEMKQTHQGYADESAWARGQAWALYGYTMMYRETGRQEYLEQARHIAHFIKNHPRLPEDKIPYWDFDYPDTSNALRDASAGAIMASAFAELSQLDKSEDAKEWLKLAEIQVRSLSSPEYLAEVGTNGNFILKHSVGNFNKKSEVDVPLTYADYYYVEALLRLKEIENEK